jgi:hypothetical protein
MTAPKINRLNQNNGPEDQVYVPEKPVAEPGKAFSGPFSILPEIWRLTTVI